MKTKIIYISGNEVFEMAEIRAAFDQVRSTLGLASDTILFGVPVDCDCALSAGVADDTPQTTVVNTNATIVPDTESVRIALESPVIPTVTDENVSVETDDFSIVKDTEYDDEKIDSPVCESVLPDTPAPEQVPEAPVITESDIKEDVDSDPESDKVIPILSILSSQEPVPESDSTSDPIVTAPVSETVVETVTETVTISSVDGIETPDTEKDTEPVADIAPDSTEKIDLDKMLDEEMPTVPVEKTIEQLLESMTPLREDVASDTLTESSDTDPGVSSFDSDDDTDATLAKLASEFAETQDKIVVPAKTKGNGKIERLKGMISFKPRREEPSGFIGDLFNWAGGAANDDDFAIPGFFTPLSKKQDD